MEGWRDALNNVDPLHGQGKAEAAISSSTQVQLLMYPISIVSMIDTA